MIIAYNILCLKAAAFRSEMGLDIIHMKLCMVSVLMNFHSIMGVCQNVVVEVPVTVDKVTVKQGASIEGPVTMNITNLTFHTLIGILSVDDFGSYCRVTFEFPNSELKLEDGDQVGQIILIEGSPSNVAWAIFDNPSPNGNVDLLIGRVLSKGDVLQLIWNGTNWIEVGFRNN